MALRIKDGGIGGTDHPVGVHILHVVIQRIDRLAGRNAARVIPDEAVVNGRHLRARLEHIVAAAQQRQFLVDHAGQLPLEGEERGRDVAIGAAVVRPVGNGRVGRIRKGLVAVDHIKVRQVARRQQEGVVRRPVVDRRRAFNRQHFAAAQNRLVNLDQPKRIDIGETQSDVAFPALARLLHQTHIGVDRIIKQVRHALPEGINPRQRAFDPAFRQRGLRPLRPATGVGRRRGRHVARIRGQPRPVPHRQVIVRQRQQTRPFDHVAHLADNGAGREGGRRFRRGGRDRQPLAGIKTRDEAFEPGVDARAHPRVGIRVKFEGEHVARRAQERSRHFDEQGQRAEAVARRGRGRGIAGGVAVDDRHERLVQINLRAIPCV